MSFLSKCIIETSIPVFEKVSKSATIVIAIPIIPKACGGRSLAKKILDTKVRTRRKLWFANDQNPPVNDFLNKLCILYFGK